MSKEKKRRVIRKDERILIASRTKYRCGYCGVELGKRFHIDHVEPFSKQSSTCDNSNLMAACAPCNLFKSMLSVNQFRREISYQAERAHKTSVNFRTALRFKQVKVKRTEIVFYYEKLKQDQE